MDVPVALAIGAAYLVSVHATVTGNGETYFDSVTMFTFFLLGARFLEQGLRHRLAGYDTLLGMLPQHATRLVVADGEQCAETIDTRNINPGDRLRVTPGTCMPADGTIVAGSTEVDESALTGEAAWVTKDNGEKVFAGTMNITHSIELEVTSSGSATRIAAIAQLANRANLDRPAIVDFTDTVARYFVVCVLVLAATAFVFWSFVDPSLALTAMFATLVVSCPCALSLATPAAITAATTALRRVGFVVTRAHVLERMARATNVIFDKTGTLTSGLPCLTRTTTHASLDADGCLAIAAALESHANHPLAKAFLTASSGGRTLSPDAVSIHPGAGVEGDIDGTAYRLGHAEFCGIPEHGAAGALKYVYLSSQGAPIARFEFTEALRVDARATLEALGELGLGTELLSGDQAGPTRIAAAKLDNLPVTSGASPEAKLAHVQALVEAGRRVVMVGDGINDVPSLAAATVSIAPLEATDLAKHESDAILLTRGLAPLAAAFRLARRTRRIISQNLGWALGYNLLTIPLAALGLIPPWLAALGMSLSSLLVTLNAARLSRTPAEMKG
jgi:Cu2+-exporting ATPase